jgi:hypothetical protein
MRSASGGLVASLGSLDIGLPPVWRRRFARAAATRRAAACIAGDKIISLAITEPGGGSDVANLRTRARARWRPLRGQRLQDLHHLRYPCRRLKRRAGGGPAAIAYHGARQQSDR